MQFSEKQKSLIVVSHIMFRLGYFLYYSKFSIFGFRSISLSKNDVSDTAVNASAYLD